MYNTYIQIANARHEKLGMYKTFKLLRLKEKMVISVKILVIISKSLPICKYKFKKYIIS